MRHLLLLLFTFVAAAENDNSAIDKSSMESNYWVDVYECDNELQPLSEGRKKKLGQSYRLCFEPNQNAREAEVGIAQVNSWEWEFDDQILHAVIDGQSVGGVNHLYCLDGGTLCVMDSMLTTAFYANPGTVKGKGTVSLTSVTDSFPVKASLFQFKFNFVFKDGNGEDMEDEKVAELLQAVNEHNNGVIADKEADDGEL